MSTQKRRLTVVWTLVELLWLLLSFGALLAVSQVTQLRAEQAQSKAAAAAEHAAYAKLKASADADRAAHAKLKASWDKQHAAQQQKIARLEQDLERERQARKREGGIRIELLGLRGELKRVVFVVDRSGSMGQARPGVADEQQRWQYVQGIVDTWVRHLPVRELKLITFANSASAFPAEPDVFLDVGGQQADEHRKQLQEQLQSQKPKGGTNTREALELACASPGVDSIVLFTDGAPNFGSGSFDAKAAAEILTFLKDRPRKVPVNVVALGDYFSPETGGFLLQVANITGGRFLAM